MKARSAMFATALGAVLGVVLTLATPGEASAACTCMSPKRPACEVYWQTAAIFVGRVVTIQAEEAPSNTGANDLTSTVSSQQDMARVVIMEVLEDWQGVDGEKRVEVRTGAGGGDCGFDFEDGETYVVYANRARQTSRLETGICSRTAKLEDAAIDLAYMRGLARADNTASLYGLVIRERQAIDPTTLEPGRRPDPGGPLRDVEVVLEGDRELRMQTIDEEGWYKFDQLPEGRYRIQVVVPDVEEQERWRIQIPVTPACIWRNLIVAPLPISN